MTKISYAGYRFPPDIIQQAIWLYLRFTLSFRDVEDLLAERGIMDEVYLKIDGRMVYLGGFPSIFPYVFIRRPAAASFWCCRQSQPGVGKAQAVLEKFKGTQGNAGWSAIRRRSWCAGRRNAIFALYANEIN